MIISHPDQMARVREYDKDGVMFPQGIHQCVAYCFAMEGVPAYERSVHAKMIEMVDDGWVQSFPIDGVNMSGLTTIEKRGECAKIRESIHKILVDEPILLNAIHAKYALDFLQSKYDGMVEMVSEVTASLNSGRYSVQRGRNYVADVISHVCCSPKKKEECSVMAISRMHGVNHDRVSRDATRVKRIIGRLERRAFLRIEYIFAISGIIPLH